MVKKLVIVRVMSIIALCALAAALCSFIRPAPVPAGESMEPSALRALNVCRAYIEGRDFTTAFTGDVEARVFGVRYKQRVSGGREVSSCGDCSERAQSASAFVKAALCKSVRGGRYFVSVGRFVRGDVSYPEPEELTAEQFVSRYGAPPRELTKFVLDGNILSAKRTGDGEYTFSLASSAAELCRADVRTALGSDSYPDYRSVELVLYTDGVKPLRTVVREVMFIDKFGGVECTSVTEERFIF